MTIAETLEDIRNNALGLQMDLLNDDEETSHAAFEAYQELVDQFYTLAKDYLALHQYEAAQEDFEYFLVLLDLAIAFYERGMDKDASSPSSRTLH